MNKSKQSHASTKPVARKRTKSRRSSQVAPNKRQAIAGRAAKTASATASARPDTKHAKIIAMLRAPAGATVTAMMTATGWQQHSVRGFLAGVIRKKLGLNLVSEKTEKDRVYRIKDKTHPAREVAPPQQLTLRHGAVKKTQSWPWQTIV